MRFFEFLKKILIRRPPKKRQVKKRHRRSSPRYHAIKKTHRKQKRLKKKRVLTTRTRPHIRKKPVQGRSGPRRARKRSKQRIKRPELSEKEVGVITHYFDKISVGVLRLSRPLAVGSIIHIKGIRNDYTQAVSSMQHERREITYAQKGMEVGIKVTRAVSVHDAVYMVN
jgi:hypothetical protein